MQLIRSTILAASVALAPVLMSSTALAKDQSKASAGLIPRKDIFGNPTRTAATVSPDGKFIAFLAPKDGVLNVWVAPIVAPEEAKPVTNETVRPIRSFFWAPDGSRVMYIQDKGGNENWLLYGVDLATGQQTNYTDVEKTQVRVVSVSPLVTDRILISMNNRDQRFHDVYSLNLKTGERTLVRQNDEGYAGFVADWNHNLIFAQKQTPGGGFALERIGKDGKTTPYATIPSDDNLTTGIAGTTADGRTVYMRDSRDRNTAALLAIDLETGKQTVLATDDKADIGGVLRHPTTGEAQAYSVNYKKNEWFPLGDALKADIEFLNREAKGEWGVQSRSQDDKLWTIVVDRVTEPVTFYLYDRTKKTLTKLFVTRPELEGKRLAPMHAVEIKSRDGLTLVSMLSLPPGSDKDGDGRPDKPVPMVLNVHGGPWARDSFGYNSEHQWLANRGYAVLAVNYRGSTGFGKDFINAANMEFAGKMHDDLIDAVNWAVKEGIAPRDKIAIYGGSYGGYATLVGMTFTPDVFACGVDIVGPSSLVTLIQSFPAYWQPLLEGTWYKRVGDPRTEEGKKALLERSPITRVDQIKRPLLIAQGQNDPRVTKLESDQLAAAMTKRNIPVTYVNYTDEGHGFARPPNRISFYAIAEGFLSKCLGGAYQPIGDDFKGANLQVLEGAQHVPGLKEAAAKLN